MDKKIRSFYYKGEESSSSGRSYGGGKEGSGHGGGYPSRGESPKKGPAYQLGERVIEARSFKLEKENSNSRGARTGRKAKSQRKGQRRHAA